jgi:acyl-CoA dehydrogenase
VSTESTEEDADLTALRAAVRCVVKRFDDDYWAARDADGEFPREFHRAMAEGGWLGITMPQDYGGAGLGVRAAVAGDLVHHHRG